MNPTTESTSCLFPVKASELKKSLLAKAHLKEARHTALPAFLVAPSWKVRR